MKQNRIFDQNSSQKARSWHYNMDTNRAEAQFADGSAIAIDCLAIEDEYGNTPAQRAELDWLLYNKPLECVQLVLIHSGRLYLLRRHHPERLHSRSAQLLDSLRLDDEQDRPDGLLPDPL